MGDIEGVTAAALRGALETAEEPKAVKRLMIALAYLDGVSVGTLVERYGIPQSTVYSWLDRFEERPLADALRDDDRPGRPPKLGPDDRSALAPLDLPGREKRLARGEHHPRYGMTVTDAVFMTSRDGLRFTRRPEAFIRPGPRREVYWFSVNWTYRSST